MLLPMLPCPHGYCTRFLQTFSFMIRLFAVGGAFLVLEHYQRVGWLESAFWCLQRG